ARSNSRRAWAIRDGISRGFIGAPFEKCSRHGLMMRKPGHYRLCEHSQEKSMNNQRGFTLLEMMVVVAIIAILAAILIPNFTHARAQAATSACMSNMKTIATAMELYYTDNQAYPVVSEKAVNAVPGLSAYMGNQNPVDPAGSG